MKLQRFGDNCYKSYSLALAGVTQWTGHWPAICKFEGSIPCEGTCLGCGPGPWLGLWEKQPHICISLPPSLLSENKFKKSFFKKKKLLFSFRIVREIATWLPGLFVVPKALVSRVGQSLVSVPTGHCPRTHLVSQRYDCMIASGGMSCRHNI